MPNRQAELRGSEKETLAAARRLFELLAARDAAGIQAELGDLDAAGQTRAVVGTLLDAMWTSVVLGCGGQEIAARQMIRVGFNSVADARRRGDS